MIVLTYANHPYGNYSIARDEPALVLDKSYNVPCLRVQDPNKVWFIPVFGLPHADGPEVMQDELTSGFYHFHTDYRFFTVTELNRFDRQGSILIYYRNQGITEETARTQNITVVLTWQIRPYSRKWGGHYPVAKPLRQKFQDCSLKCNRCPHQGFDLTNIEPTEVDGKKIIICPGHSLAWDYETGEPHGRI